MKSSLILAALATLAFGSAIAPQAQDDASLARRAPNDRNPLAANAASNLIARQAWADSDILEVTLVDGSKRYISYGALKRNGIPCSRRGNSFFNCKPGQPANEWQRGCSAINRCRAVNTS